MPPAAYTYNNNLFLIFLYSTCVIIMDGEIELWIIFL